MMWYSRVLCHHPYAVMSSVVVVVTTCLVISLTTRPLPSFTDPSLGFEARGTTISQRAVAWENLLDASRYRGPLSTNPSNDPRLNLLPPRPPPDKQDGPPPVHKHKACLEMTPEGLVEVPDCDEDPRNNTQAQNSSETTETPISELEILVNNEKMREELVFAGEESRGEYTLQRNWEEDHHPHHTHLGDDGFFCAPVAPEYGRVIMRSGRERDTLLTLPHLRSVCRLDHRLRSLPQFHDICETWSPGRCCPSWSLPNYIALLSNRSSCHDITQEDVTAVGSLLRHCSSYLNLQLDRGCQGPQGCSNVPRECLTHDAVYTILHYLMDAAFIKSTVKSDSEQKERLEETLSFTAVFLPIARGSQALPYYEALEVTDLTLDNVTVAAVDFGLKYALFDKLLVSNAYLLGVGGGAVLLLMWCYTGSLFITLITITSVASALIIAYFLYTFIFKITFFPYMNVLSAVIAIGIGADDTFVYCRVWTLAKQDKNTGTMVKLVADTFHHAAASIAVTSLTTAAAFFASCVSHITAIKCFSIFAGTVVLANLVLMLTWVPACVVVAEQWGASTCCLCVPPAPVYAPQLPARCSVLCSLPLRLCYFCSESARVFFDKVLPFVVVKLRYVWVLLLGGAAVLSAVTVFYHPGLRLPDSQEFQLFSRDHLFEQYDLDYKYKFWFERNLRRDVVNRLPVRVVWGVRAEDNGDPLDPASKGSVVFDEEFDVAHPQSQKWLREFCRDLRNQTFYFPTPGIILPNCFIDTFLVWMNGRMCHDPVDKNRYPCCMDSAFPYPRWVFDKCIHKAIEVLHMTPRSYFDPGVAGPRFSRDTGKVVAAVVEYDTKTLWSLSYAEMEAFFKEVEAWVQSRMKDAPYGMRGGWFTSYLEFYDVQRSLSVGTGVGVAVAVSVSLAVLVVTTRNVVVSVLAVVSVASVILVTLACLVLLGWRLNVLESVTITVAIGLAVDLTLHYGVAYRLSPEPKREAAVSWAISRLGSPVFMAAVTSLAAGLAMLPANVLAYVHIGTFLTLITSVSYVYATLFFLSLLRIFGPESGCGQLSCPKPYQCSPCGSDGHQHVDKTVYQQAYMSESTLSTSSTSCPPPQTHPSSDTHELEPLTALRLAGRARLGHGSTRHKVGLADHSTPEIMNNHAAATHPEAAGVSPGIGGGGTRAGRSGSLSNSVRSRDRTAFIPRKVSLPSPGGAVSEGGEPSPRHSVAPASSATTILYSEPDTTDYSQQQQQQQLQQQNHHTPDYGQHNHHHSDYTTTTTAPQHNHHHTHEGIMSMGPPVLESGVVVVA